MSLIVPEGGKAPWRHTDEVRSRNALARSLARSLRARSRSCVGSKQSLTRSLATGPRRHARAHQGCDVWQLAHAADPRRPPGAWYVARHMAVRAPRRGNAAQPNHHNSGHELRVIWRVVRRCSSGGGCWRKFAATRATQAAAAGCGADAVGRRRAGESSGRLQRSRQCCAKGSFPLGAGGGGDRASGCSSSGWRCDLEMPNRTRQQHSSRGSTQLEL